MRRRPCVLAVWVLLVATGFFASAQPLDAQTIENPKTVEFDPSPDHDAVIDGTTLVDRYEMDFFVLETGQPVHTLSLGKPALAGDGRIRIDFAALLAQPLRTGTIYSALIAAVGPGGRASSIVAPDTFIFTAPCTFAVSPTSPASLAASGGSASVTVTAPSGCAWTASGSASWLSITSGGSGTGNGTVSYTATGNTTTSARSATLTVAGHSVTVTQDADSCSFAVSPTQISIAAAGGHASILVTTTGGCAWTSSASSNWLSITSGSKGSGTGPVTIAATSNGTASTRTTTLTVAGQSVVVTQSAKIPASPTNVRIVRPKGED